MTEDLFLGHPMRYWIELEKTAMTKGITEFIEEIALLRGKISFYESRIDQMVEVKNHGS